VTQDVMTIILILLCIILGYLWAKEIGFMRGFCAAICRFLWVLPIILGLVPETITENLPSTIVQRPIHVLLDDSRSMKESSLDPNLSATVEQTLSSLESNCRMLGCAPKITNLSALRAETSKGFTPLSSALEPWLFKIGSEPWVLITDGSDWRPAKPWGDHLRGRGALQSGRHQGLILGFGQPSTPGYWIEDASIPSFAFEGRSVNLGIKIHRAQDKGLESVQVQVAIDGQAMSSAKAVFADGSTEAFAEVIFSAPVRGAHLVTVRSLPIGGEKDTWDNEFSASMEVLPNTIGVLHLLGAPSWDGRFLRRYLKAEPKFDLISFFILRDPWDSQAVNERELSLIPFPVERLFNEELSSFRVLIIQNFTMHHFLQPEYQKSLVQFVLGGGGLLFIGGPRALTEGDFSNSPISEILPLTLIESENSNTSLLPGFPFNGLGQGSGGTFDADQKFNVEFADPDSNKRALASVYDDWKRMGSRITSTRDLAGIHSMSRFKFKEQEITPLLNAKLSSGSKVPLAVATYPGQGRAIWLFSDNIWKNAIGEDAERSRYDYNQFFDSAMTWLMRDDRKQPLVLSAFDIVRDDLTSDIHWHVRLSGAAAQYVGAKVGDWILNVCGRSLPIESIRSEQMSNQEWVLSGVSQGRDSYGDMCKIKIDGKHPAFGSVGASALAMFSATLLDDQMSPSARKLLELENLTGGLLVREADRDAQVKKWLERWTGAEVQALPNRFKTWKDFYWPLRLRWFWILCLMLPLEVLIRRYHKLFASEVS
jgi:hypothetical protein